MSFFAQQGWRYKAKVVFHQDMRLGTCINCYVR